MRQAPGIARGRPPGYDPVPGPPPCKGPRAARTAPVTILARSAKRIRIGIARQEFASRARSGRAARFFTTGSGAMQGWPAYEALPAGDAPGGQARFGIAENQPPACNPFRA